MALMGRTGICLIVALLVAGCGSSDGSPSASGALGQSARCSPASSALLAAISEGLTVTGGGSLGAGYVVKSNDFAEVWMVAAEINGPGM
jgi:hypothetical protein